MQTPLRHDTFGNRELYISKTEDIREENVKEQESEFRHKDVYGK